MEPTFIVAGRITREFILPPVGQPLLDEPGGSLLYAAGGLRVWSEDIGLLARVGEDFPRAWLHAFETRGLNTDGITILPKSLDVRNFLAYNENFEVVKGNPVSQFARRKWTFPKALIGYQTPSDTPNEAGKIEEYAPVSVEIPSAYREACAVHLCPLDFVSHTQLASVFKAGSTTTLTLEPDARYMNPQSFKNLRVIIAGLTAFLPSEQELRGLFWGETHDLWEMAEAVGAFGCEIVVIKRSAQGQSVYDVLGKYKWEIPAYPARRADPTGAGDAFCGGFLAGYKKTYDPLEAALYGNVSASLKVEGTGAFYPLSVLPGLAEARLIALRDLVRKV